MAQICKFFQSGTCKFGESCANLHESRASTSSSGERPGVKSAQSFCVFFRRGTCKQGDGCKFSHSAPTNEGGIVGSKVQNETTRSIPCNFWLKGHCIHGNDCRFSHSDTLKEPDTPSTPSSSSKDRETLPSEPNSPLDGRENDSTWNLDDWGDNTEEHSLGNNVQQVDPFEAIEVQSHSPLSQENSVDENATTTDLNSPLSDREESRTSGIRETINEDVKPENYPLPKSPPTDSFDPDTDMTESTEPSPVIEIPPIRKLNKSPCVFFQRGACNRGIACKFLHSIDSDQRASPEAKPANDGTRLAPCEFWNTGKCIYGESCRFLHSTTNPVSDNKSASEGGEVDADNGFEPHAPPDDDTQAGHDGVEYTGPWISTSSMSISSLPTPPGSERHFHHQDNTSSPERQGPNVFSMQVPTLSSPDDTHSDEYSHQHLQEWKQSYTADHSYSPISETRASLQATISPHNLPGEDDQEQIINSITPQLDSLEISEPEVIPHWSEYADPLVDPSVPFCKFYAQARCTQGDLCTFRHSLSVNEYALLFRDAQPALWSSQAQRVRAGYTKPVSASTFGICKFYPLGTCRNGDACTYLHVPPSDLLPTTQQEEQTWSSDDDPQIPPQPEWDPQVCWEYSKNGYCKRGDDCRYRHEILESQVQTDGEQEQNEGGGWGSWNDTQMPSQSRRDPPMCREYSQNGYCRGGDNCHYRHEISESPVQANGEQGQNEGGEWGSWNDTQIPSRPKWGPPMCREYSQNGYCRRGDNCRYRHEMSESPEQAASEQGQNEEGGWGSWTGNKRSTDRRLPCKYHAQGHCRKGDDCAYLHENQGSASEGAGGWDDPPKSDWDTQPIDSWASLEVTDEVPAEPDKIPAESDENFADPEATVTASGWPVDDDATWAMAWTVPEPGPCKFYIEGRYRKGGRCTLSHKDPEPSWDNIDTEPTSWDVPENGNDHLDESRSSEEQDFLQDQDEEIQITSEGPDTSSPNTTEVDESHSPNDDEKTWAVPWVNDVDKSDEPPQYNAPCLAFGQGYCKWGDACFYLHISPPDPTSQTREPSPVEIPPNVTSDNQSPEPDLELELEEAADDQNDECPPPEPASPADLVIKRSMFNCAVQFSTKCFPMDIMTASESSRVLLANLSPEAPYDDEFQNDIIGLYGTLQDVTLDETETAVTATIECTEYNKAAEAVAQLDGQTYNSMAVSARLDSVAEMRSSPPLVSHSIKVSWPAPSTFAWVYYPTITIAKAAEDQLSGKLFEGRKIKTEFQRPRPRQLGPFPIKIANLPADTTTEAITALCDGCKLVQLGKPSYFTSPIPDIRAFLEDHGPLDFLDVLPSDRTGSKVTAFAQFGTDSSLLSDLISLSGVKQPFIGNSILWIQAVHHVKYNVPQKHLQLVRDEITQLCDTYKDQCSILVHEEQSTVHLSGPFESAAAFGRANIALQSLLHGEILSFNGEKVWDEYFDLSSGASAVEKLNAKNSYCIMLDNLTQTVRIIGGETGRRHARSLVPRLLAKVRDLRRIIPLDRFTLAPLLDGGMQRLINDLGANKVTLDVRVPVLIVRGEAAVHDKVQQFLESSAPTSSKDAVALEGRESSCIVCCRQPRVPIELSCRHVYCEACLQHVLRSSAGPLFTPPRCIAMAEVSEDEPPELDLQCTEHIPYTVVRDVLPILDKVSFLRSSLLSHLRSYPEEFIFCPTPNCETVYRSRKEHTVYRCPSCSTRICSTCHHEYHGGLTCDERSSIGSEPTTT